MSKCVLFMLIFVFWGTFHGIYSLLSLAIASYFASKSLNCAEWRIFYRKVCSSFCTTLLFAEFFTQNLLLQRSIHWIICYISSFIHVFLHFFAKLAFVKVHNSNIFNALTHLRLCNMHKHNEWNFLTAIILYRSKIAYLFIFHALCITTMLNNSKIAHLFARLFLPKVLKIGLSLFCRYCCRCRAVCSRCPIRARKCPVLHFCGSP